MHRMDLISHLTRLSKTGTPPNFFVSLPYLNFSKAKVRRADGWEWLEAEDMVLFPPLRLEGARPLPSGIARIWSDFQTTRSEAPGWITEPLDWEYLYNPFDFNFMNGGRWNVFRKNVRKWPRENIGWEYGESCDASQIEPLFVDWVTPRAEGLHDADFIMHCVLDQPPGIHHRYLTDGSGQLVAINVFDRNYAYINYRFLICKNEPHLDEFARFLFYRDEIIQTAGMLVNDGGTLNNAGLERFKDKLNPVKKRLVNTWIKP